MGLIKRFKRITTSRIENYLSSAEDPELLLPQLVKEMEDQVRSASNAEAKAKASVKAAQRAVDELEAKLKQMEKGAQLAMDQGDEDTARDALSSQIDLEKKLEIKKEALARSEQAYEDASTARKNVQTELSDLKNKKEEILTRARVSKNRKSVNQSVAAPSSSAGSILDAVARMEGKVEENEAELEIQNEITSESRAPSLDKRLKDLEEKASVESRLEALKKKTGKQGKKD